MAYAKDLRQRMGRLAADIQSMVDACKNQGNRGFTSAEKEKFDRLTGAFSEVETLTHRIERAGGPGMPAIDEAGGLSEITDMFRLSAAEKRRREREADPAARAFSNYLRRGMEGLEGEDRTLMASRFVSHEGARFMNTMSTSTGSQGGYTVPAGFSEMLEQAKKWFGGIDGVVGKFETATGNPWPWPTINDTANRGRIIGQNQQVIETDLTFGQETFNAFIGSSDLVLIPLALMQDSYFDLDGLVARLLGTRLGRLYNWKCTVGAGTTEPTGIVTAAVAAGNVLQLGSGNTASISYNNLVDLEHSVDPAYRYNDTSRWMFSDATLKLLKKLTDSSNRPLWQPGLTASFREGAAVDLTASRPKILEHEYCVNQDMATPAASAYSMLFGDMDTFKVREVTGGTTVLVLRERYSDFLQVGFIAFQRFDSNLIDAGTHPIAVLQQSAT